MRTTQNNNERPSRLSHQKPSPKKRTRTIGDRTKMNKKKTEKGELHQEEIDPVLNAEERRVTGATTSDQDAPFKPAGLEFRDQVVGKPQDEFSMVYPSKTGISKKGEKEE